MSPCSRRTSVEAADSGSETGEAGFAHYRAIAAYAGDWPPRYGVINRIERGNLDLLAAISLSRNRYKERSVGII